MKPKGYIVIARKSARTGRTINQGTTLRFIWKGGRRPLFTSLFAENLFPLLCKIVQRFHGEWKFSREDLGEGLNGDVFESWFFRNPWSVSLRDVRHLKGWYPGISSPHFWIFERRDSGWCDGKFQELVLVSPFAGGKDDEFERRYLLLFGYEFVDTEGPLTAHGTTRHGNDANFVFTECALEDQIRSCPLRNHGNESLVEIFDRFTVVGSERIRTVRHEFLHHLECLQSLFTVESRFMVGGEVLSVLKIGGSVSHDTKRCVPVFSKEQQVHVEECVGSREHEGDSVFSWRVLVVFLGEKFGYVHNFLPGCRQCEFSTVLFLEGLSDLWIFEQILSVVEEHRVVVERKTNEFSLPLSGFFKNLRYEVVQVIIFWNKLWMLFHEFSEIDQTKRDGSRCHHVVGERIK
ncbi:Transposase Tan1-Aspergillus niger [Thermotoga neapolitana DSM 4359]|uniref:Transposase Tan1-Aspergillus niger n=1 Tax=Thermotoga neapolitana (strain ATCC 49049 / DSM 4359 / NBRC 107923 / NS-E) TaxID=309803 RepID=B9KC37_THENN|nr:Transposase Tan1-Aspergillus niger [Thermotoga neapolitana DSM 4359]